MRIVAVDRYTIKESDFKATVTFIPASEITYRIINGPNPPIGMFVYEHSIHKPIVEFTQADINRGLVQFVLQNTGAPTNATIQLKVGFFCKIFASFLFWFLYFYRFFTILVSPLY